MSGVLLTCVRCRASVTAQELYCENCGTDLTAVRPVPLDQVPAPAAPVDGAAAAGVASAPQASVPDDAVPGDAVPGDVVPADAVPTDAVPGDVVPADAAGRPGGVLVDEPDLTRTATACPACGGEVAADGYCGQCGSPAPVPRHHWREQPASWVAAVCDRGVRHAQNEDAVAVAALEAPDSFAVLVVCDGVSSSTGSDVASLAAVRAARDVLAGALDDQVPGEAVPPQTPATDVTAEPTEATADGAPAADVTDEVPTGESTADGEPDPFERAASTSTRSRAAQLAARVVQAGLAGNAAVVAAAGSPPGPNPPSCTFVAAVLEGDLLVSGWVGDSRAYWLPDAGHAVQLSADDSWAGEAMAAGFTREEAERAPQAHAITRWFGVDAPDPRPRTGRRLIDGPGWVLLCSDGLWNYCSPATALQELVAHAVQRTGPDPGRLAEELVGWATQQGGHDNITVALARVR